MLTVNQAVDYNNWPSNFRPNLSPMECIQAGIFGGVYFDALRPELIDAKEFPSEWFHDLTPEKYSSHKADPARNRYKVMAGTYQKEWEANGWIRQEDPRGWFQWYCRYWLGRRSEDDARQIERWVRFANVHRGRFARQLYGRILKAGGPDYIEDITISPVIRQSLLHWAYQVNFQDYTTWLSSKAQVL